MLVESDRPERIHSESSERFLDSKVVSVVQGHRVGPDTL